MPSGIYNRTEKTRKKMSKSHTGLKLSEETKRKISKAVEGDKHSQWKGNEAKMGAMHRWVEKHKGKPKICEYCGATAEKRKLVWANKNHTYKRKLDDYISLCYSCHKKYDLKKNK